MSPCLRLGLTYTVTVTLTLLHLWTCRRPNISCGIPASMPSMNAAVVLLKHFFLRSVGAVAKQTAVVKTSLPTCYKWEPAPAHQVEQQQQMGHATANSRGVRTVLLHSKSCYWTSVPMVRSFNHCSFHAMLMTQTAARGHRPQGQRVDEQVNLQSLNLKCDIDAVATTLEKLE